MKRVLIGICGGIAAYKICEVISTLFKTEQVEIKVILTESAQQFITPLTITTLSRHPVYTDQNFWQPINYRPLHIELGEWADVFLIAPLTAHTLAKLALGLADNLLTNTVLASNCPILLAPAMNTDMWLQLSVQNNWQLLTQNPRYHTTGPGSGLLACDRVGSGRMSEPSAIISYILSLFYTQGKKDLKGKKVLISGGGTREFFDPVRYIGNPSSGKMGIALVKAALHRGAEVKFVHGIIDDHLLANIQEARLIPITNSEEMYQQMMGNFTDADIIIMSAAVADVKPSEYYGEKIAKKDLPSALELSPVNDIIAELGRLKKANQRLIGFAAQTGDIITPAREKMMRKNLDIIVANPIDQVNSGFGNDRNQAIFLDNQNRQIDIENCDKLDMGHQLFDFILYPVIN